MDAAVVGTIAITPTGLYLVQAKGLVPAIDGISGASWNDVWSKITDRVRSGGVFFTRLITDVSDAHRA